jgi:hypothetical protein
VAAEDDVELAEVLSGSDDDADVVAAEGDSGSDSEGSELVEVVLPEGVRLPEVLF